MNAIILAGGFGSRLKPLTDHYPKPMLSVANVPMIDYCVSHLRSFGISDIVYTLGYMPEKIIEWVSGYRGMKSSFSIEEQPLGTAGGVKLAEELLHDVFLVVSGDALENIDYRALMEQHFHSGALVTMAVTHVINPSLYGVVQADENGKVTHFIEKPKANESFSKLVNCGVYAVSKAALKLIPAQTKFDFSKDLFPILQKMNKLYAYHHKGYWSDIGDIKSYFEANFYMASGGFFPSAPHYNKEMEYSYQTNGLNANLISASASVVGQCRSSIVGHGSCVASGASIDNCIVLKGTVVRGRTINAIIGKDFQVTVVNDEPTAILQNNVHSANIFS